MHLTLRDLINIRLLNGSKYLLKYQILIKLVNRIAFLGCFILTKVIAKLFQAQK